MRGMAPMYLKSLKYVRNEFAAERLISCSESTSMRSANQRCCPRRECAARLRPSRSAQPSQIDAPRHWHGTGTVLARHWHGTGTALARTGDSATNAVFRFGGVSRAITHWRAHASPRLTFHPAAPVSPRTAPPRCAVRCGAVRCANRGGAVRASADVRVRPPGTVL